MSPAPPCSLVLRLLPPTSARGAPPSAAGCSLLVLLDAWPDSGCCASPAAVAVLAPSAASALPAPELLGSPSMPELLLPAAMAFIKASSSLLSALSPSCAFSWLTAAASAFPANPSASMSLTPPRSALPSCKAESCCCRPFCAAAMSVICCASWPCCCLSSERPVGC